MDLIRALLPQSAAVDIETASLSEMSALVAEVHASPAILVASYHNFDETPPLQRLLALQQQALDAGADAVKFATKLTGPQDLITLIQLLAQPHAPPIAVMGMGPLGRLSRLTLAGLGSILNYGYLDRATVPGQWPAARLKHLLAEMADAK
jgi:3-dehydroquinate dehydratase-1